MGGGGSKQTSSSGPPEWMVPMVQSFLGRAEGLSNTPYEAYGGERVAGLAGESEAGLTELGKTAQGDYLGANPYLDEAYQAASRGITDQYRYATAPSSAAAASRAGALGGSAYDEYRQQQQFGLGENLRGLAGQMYGGSYEAERGRQVNSAQAATTLGESVRRGYEQEQLDYPYQQFQERKEYPYKQLDVFGSALGTGMGGTQTTVKSGK